MWVGSMTLKFVKYTPWSRQTSLDYSYIQVELEKSGGVILLPCAWELFYIPGIMCWKIFFIPIRFFGMIVHGNTIIENTDINSQYSY